MSFKFNPITGNLDLVGDSSAASTPSVVDATYEAAESISALKAVYLDSPSTVRVATSGADVKPIGVAITAASAGAAVAVRVFGQLDDAAFTFAVNDHLFVSPTGSLTTSAPTTGFLTEVAHAVGIGSIFVNVKNQIVL